MVFCYGSWNGLRQLRGRSQGQQGESVRMRRVPAEGAARAKAPSGSVSACGVHGPERRPVWPGSSEREGQ